MGVVYQADDLKLRRRVALKCLPEGVVHDRQAIERLKRRADLGFAMDNQQSTSAVTGEEVNIDDVVRCVTQDSGSSPGLAR